MNTLRDLFPILYADVCIMRGNTKVCTIRYNLDITHALSDKYLDAEISRIECENEKVLIWLEIEKENNND